LSCGQLDGELVEQCLKFLRVGGFRQVVIEAGLFGPPAILRLSPAGERDESHTRHLRAPPQFPGHFEAAHDRQPEVEEHHVRAIGDRSPDRAASVQRLSHLVPGTLQARGEHLDEIRVVVDDEDLQAPARHPGAFRGRLQIG